MKEFRNSQNGEVLNETNFRLHFPNTAFPIEITAEIASAVGFALIEVVPPPVGTTTQRVVRDGVEEISEGQWGYRWMIFDIPEAELASQETARILGFKNMVIRRVQKRLDDFAATRGYGDEMGRNAILSAISYLDDVNPEYAADAARCKLLRTQTWDTLHDIENAVGLGERVAPTTYEEIEAELPLLAW